MADRVNHLGQPIGDDVVWAGAKTPPRSNMDGQYCRLEPIDIDRHAADLFKAFSADKTGGIWTYLFTDPFATEADLREWMNNACLGDDPLFHAVIDKRTDKAVGFATFMRIDPVMGVIEVGNINFAPALQRTPAATEAMFLMMQRVFNELGYRRYEWKCDNLNAPSHKAAKRLGFTYEGLFRQALVYKDRNRDTAWFSIIDTEWPPLKKAFIAWLDADNFDESGNQIRKLEEFR
ncbi:GNAT family N-acetyltransferase [Rhodobacterales bacterium 52_120_T64]|nr:GNAT family N-acetyltransferase [Rhodobacterales bacterium 52_120_T64]